ncbi:type IV toxin-antitoxin system AbiEi family antitoxin domain-containing protein [Paenibacillus rhizoplanae]
MNEQIVTRAMRVLEKHNGFARTRDFLEAGISPYYVKKSWNPSVKLNG